MAGVFLLGALFTPTSALFAQETPPDEKQALRNQLKEIEQQINEYRQNIEEAKKDQKTLKGELTILDTEIKKQKLQVKEIDLSLREVERGILDKNQEIDGLEEKLKTKKQLLSASLKRLNEYDTTSIVSIFLRSESISSFFNQVRYLENIQNEINEFIQNIDAIRNDLEQQKSDLEDKKEDIVRLKSLGIIQKEALEKKQKEKNSLLTTTKGQEKFFTETIKKSQKDISIIKQQLFTLENVGISMSFGEAIEYAKYSGEKTGIRPAFLLAIFQIESRLGTYVGGGSWKIDMKPAERPLFQKITSKLGLDPNAMPVSKRPYYGWGGAMGAAQFIPSTWLAYENQIASLTGHNPPSPWNIEDAFIGSGLKLVSNGAGSKEYAHEHKAAAMYLAGKNYKKRVAQSYANNVMDWAEYYQGQINAVNGVGALPLRTN